MIEDETPARVIEEKVAGVVVQDVVLDLQPEPQAVSPVECEPEQAASEHDQYSSTRGAISEYVTGPAPSSVSLRKHVKGTRDLLYIIGHILVWR